MAQIWDKWDEIGHEISFFGIFLKFGLLVFLETAYDDSLEHCLRANSGKTDGKNFEKLKLDPKSGFLASFNVASLHFLDIAQDCSLGQCLMSSGAKTSKKILWPNLGLK